MKKQTILGFIKTRMNRIEKMQAEGYYLQTIYDELKGEYPEEFPFETFKVSLYRIRNKNNSPLKKGEHLSNLKVGDKKNEVSTNNTLSIGTTFRQHLLKDYDENSDN